ncbi:cation diffusion facilitator family transporter [Aliikangiella maris]|uniref:Cation diffusion facilitator family transporter n=2 Tax=Aliikangiella maris TaxID=3162458 RepID=A0ABV2BX94_9GAMM
MQNLDQSTQPNRGRRRDVAVQRVILIEGSVNLLVLVAKLVVGITTGSLAIIGDALHSLTDVANNLVAWAVLKYSSKPADKNHPYGHRKFENLAVLGLAVLLTMLAFELILQVFRREQVQIGATGWELAVMCGVLLINFTLATWQRLWAKKLNSPILQADASHTFADVLTTIIVITGWQLSAAGYVWLDQLGALIVAGMIFYLAFGLFKNSAPVLVDESAIESEQVAEAAMAIDGVEDVSRVRSRWIGNMVSVDMVIGVAHDLTIAESHHICDQVELMLENDFDVADISIHVEPIG